MHDQPKCSMPSTAIDASLKNTVLVADDDEGYRFPIVSILKDFDYKVLAAENVEEVKDKASKAGIWVIDVRLPSKIHEGIGVVRKLIGEGIKPLFDVIFITVENEEDCKTDLENFPIQYVWVDKPFELEYLLKKIKEVVEGQP